MCPAVTLGVRLADSGRRAPGQLRPGRSQQHARARATPASDVPGSPIIAHQHAVRGCGSCVPPVVCAPCHAWGAAVLAPGACSVLALAAPRRHTWHEAAWRCAPRARADAMAAWQLAETALQGACTAPRCLSRGISSSVTPRWAAASGAGRRPARVLDRVLPGSSPQIRRRPPVVPCPHFPTWLLCVLSGQCEIHSRRAG